MIFFYINFNLHFVLITVIEGELRSLGGVDPSV